MILSFDQALTSLFLAGPDLSIKWVQAANPVFVFRFVLADRYVPIAPLGAVVDR